MTPSARLEINGVEVTTRFLNVGDEEKQLLESLTVTDEAGARADALEVTIDDRDGYVSPAKGDEIRVWLGYEPKPVYMGRFMVESVRKSGPRRRQTVSAKSAELTGAIRAPKLRSWHEMILGEIARIIAAEHGLTPSVAAEAARIAIPHIDQQTESDLAFLQRLATRWGLLFKIADGHLVLAARGAKALPSGAAISATTIRPADCKSWDWESNGRGDFRAVVCSYRDDGLKKTVTAGDGASTSKFRDRRLYGSKGEAETAAKAQLSAFKRGRVTATVEAAGLPELFAESEITLNGFDSEVDGVYRAASVRHTLDGSGLRTSVRLELGPED